MLPDVKYDAIIHIFCSDFSRNLHCVLTTILICPGNVDLHVWVVFIDELKLEGVEL